jgi:putative endonuclease
LWFEGHDDINRAIAGEKELKGWRRAKKIALIELVNPTWTDLSRDWYEYEPADYKRALDRSEA